VSSTQYIEIARFKLRDAVSDEELLRAEEGVRRGPLATAPGYLSRELYRSEQGEWFVVLRFADKTSMDRLLETLRTAPDPSFVRYGALIDRDTMRVEFAWRRV
jgi:hypothetical protein